MKKIKLVLSVGIILLFLSFNIKEGNPFYIPENWPKPVYNFEDNQLTRDKFELGRTLFYDESLSRDSTISCASCHLQYSGFTHIDHALSHGIDGEIGNRNSPVLINLAWNSFFHWDGGVENLDKQAINPLIHPKEMGNNLPEVIRRLNNSKFYKKRFLSAFGDSVISTPNLLHALSNFTLALVSANSKYDLMKRGVVGSEFTEQETRGYQLFLKNCNSCHTEPLFHSNSFKRNGLKIDDELKDIGRMAITQRKSDSMLFKVPTLRNIEFSFPYMHDGRFKKLKEVVDHYSSIPAHQLIVSKELKKIKKSFSDEQKKDLIAFLKTLSDKQFLYSKDFMFPRNER